VAWNFIILWGAERKKLRTTDLDCRLTSGMSSRTNTKQFCF